MIAASVKAPEARPVSQLRLEYEAITALWNIQSAEVRHSLEVQAGKYACSLAEHKVPGGYRLPSQVWIPISNGTGVAPVSIRIQHRIQRCGALFGSFGFINRFQTWLKQMTALENSSDPAIALGASLVRYSIARHLWQQMVLTGRAVSYVCSAGEDIPSVPISQGEDSAGRFYLQQWAAFDNEDALLVDSVGEAEAYIAALQRSVAILKTAIDLAPYLAADADYRAKQNGLFGQLVNQARALARYHAYEIVETIQKRVTKNNLNRGLSLRLPYFDDQSLEMKVYEFEVIPPGRILFTPAFVVCAVCEEQTKVNQNLRLSKSTRKHLLAGLRILERAFDISNGVYPNVYLRPRKAVRKPRPFGLDPLNGNPEMAGETVEI